MLHNKIAADAKRLPEEMTIEEGWAIFTRLDALGKREDADSGFEDVDVAASTRWLLVLAENEGKVGNAKLSAQYLTAAAAVLLSYDPDPSDYPDYEEHLKFVTGDFKRFAISWTFGGTSYVTAETEEHARKIFAESFGDDGEDIIVTDPEVVRVDEEPE